MNRHSQLKLEDHEEARLEALKDYDILDTDAEPQFDDLASLASHICQTPVALISLVDRDRQWFKAKLGIDVAEMPRSISFCTHAIEQAGLMVVPDATLDARFAANPIVIAGPKVRFYAGAPLVTREGHSLGTLCVIDTVPHELKAEQQSAMLALARQVVSQLELRRTASANANLCLKAQRDARRRARQALRDSLTGLPNRSCLSIHLGRSMAKIADGAVGTSAVLMIDLDRFKQVNDTLGHAAGDELLRHVGRLLRANVRTKHCSGEKRGNDVVARLGGDEFIVLLNDLQSPDVARCIANRMIDVLSEPFQIGGHCVQIGASVGLAMIEQRHANAEEVIREADTALYAAKAAGKGQSLVFDAQMQQASMREIRLERDLRDLFADGADAAAKGGFFLQYQPIVDTNTGTPTGFEALARWRHPQLGTIAPVEFIPIAEDTGLIVELGTWVLREACAQLARWSAEHPAMASLTMNVNVARLQLLDLELVPTVAAELKKHSLAPSRLKIEITESSIMHDPDASADALLRLRALGVELYMDDFGTGHSSLGCLKRYALDGLKIDRSFIAVLAESEKSDAIVRAVMELSRCFNMKVTAEGVETSEQWWLLRKFKCQHAQGYYFAKPLDAHLAADYVLSKHAEQQFSCETKKLRAA